MRVVVDGLLTTYHISGTGDQTILLLHGWADSSATFNELSKTLSKKYQLISLDLPGSGDSDTPSRPWEIDDFAEFIANFLHKIHITKPFAILGHSNGGAIAVRGLASNKLEAGRLVLLASAGVRDQDRARKQVVKVVAKVGKTVTFALPKSMRQGLRRKLYTAVGSDMLVAEHLQETFKRTVNQDIQNDARALKLPTLLLYGQNDTATPPRFGERLKEAIAGSNLIILPDAGHFVHHDQQKMVANLIQEFLST